MLQLKPKVYVPYGNTANYTQCKSLKSIVKDHGPRTYIILNPYSEVSNDGKLSNFQD